MQFTSVGKLVNRTENEFENISGNKTRSRSAARIESEALNGGFNRSKAIVPTKTVHDSQIQSSSFNDLSTKEPQNGHKDGSSRGHSNVSGRAISHYKAEDANFLVPSITHVNHPLPAPRGDSKHDPKQSGLPDAEMLNRHGVPYSYMAREKLFGKSSSPDYLINKRLPIVLKESHHRAGLAISQELNNTNIRPIQSVSWIPINTSQQHHNYQDHLTYANFVSFNFKI